MKILTGPLVDFQQDFWTIREMQLILLNIEVAWSKEEVTAHFY